MKASRKNFNLIGKITSLIVAIVMVMSITAAFAEDTDSAYVKGKGVLVVGVTDFAPMDYKDDNGEWVGFDADMAKAFAESLGVKAEIIEINWDTKLMELNGKNIDCVWNGMTLTEDVVAAMECSSAYMNNAQVVVMTKENAEKYATTDAMKDLTFAVESGSAGEEIVASLGFTATPVSAQSDALMEVAAGTSDAAVIDSLMAGAMIGSGTAYENLVATVKLNSEEYGAGFRKGSDLAAALDEFFAASKESGLLKETAEKYGVQEALID